MQTRVKAVPSRRMARTRVSEAFPRPRDHRQAPPWCTVVSILTRELEDPLQTPSLATHRDGVVCNVICRRPFQSEWGGFTVPDIRKAGRPSWVDNPDAVRMAPSVIDGHPFGLLLVFFQVLGAARALRCKY